MSVGDPAAKRQHPEGSGSLSMQPVGCTQWYSIAPVIAAATMTTLILLFITSPVAVFIDQQLVFLCLLHCCYI